MFLFIFVFLDNFFFVILCCLLLCCFVVFVFYVEFYLYLFVVSPLCFLFVLFRTLLRGLSVGIRPTPFSSFLALVHHQGTFAGLGAVGGEKPRKGGMGLFLL